MPWGAEVGLNHNRGSCSKSFVSKRTQITFKPFTNRVHWSDVFPNIPSCAQLGFDFLISLGKFPAACGENCTFVYGRK